VKRGEFVTVALQGDFGKPRPALIIQADRFDQTAAMTILPVTSDLVDAPLLRPIVEPSEANGLRKRSQIMVDKIITTQRDKIGPVFGCLDDENMLSVTRTLAVFLSIA
jgi:mRNA interferase MazF